MADPEEVEDEQLLKKLLESIARGKSGQEEDDEATPEHITDSMAQLLAAALNQISQEEGGVEVEINPVDNVDNTVEVPSSIERQKSLGIKFSPDVRRRIVNYRKGGKRYRDIAKELGASVSGVQKVWERFLSTGTIGDKKPCLPLGRPRKFGRYNEESSLSIAEEEEEYVESTTVSTMQAVLITDDISIEEPMDVPGATVEVVATTTTPTSRVTPERKIVKKKVTTPSYREELLLRLVKDCPLAQMRDDSAMTTNEHVLNLLSSIHHPLYMEYVLGHPFGRVPSPKPFQRNEEESNVILSDSASPLGKEVLSVLGYTTKVYFNACCKPSPLFDDGLLLHSLPLSLGPGYLSDTLQQLVQLLLGLCKDPLKALKLIPDEGVGIEIQVTTSIGDLVSRSFAPPTKLSSYWNDVYYYGNLFQCCENFLSASPPSSPCLLCHSFESFAANLEILESETGSPLINTNISDDIITEQLDIHIPDSPVTIVTGQHPPDGIQYVAYSGQPHNSIEEATPTIIRRSSRKRGATSDVNEDSVVMDTRNKHYPDNYTSERELPLVVR